MYFSMIEYIYCEYVYIYSIYILCNRRYSNSKRKSIGIVYIYIYNVYDVRRKKTETYYNFLKC